MQRLFNYLVRPEVTHGALAKPFAVANFFDLLEAQTHSVGEHAGAGDHLVPFESEPAPYGEALGAYPRRSYGLPTGALVAPDGTCRWADPGAAWWQPAPWQPAPWQPQWQPTQAVGFWVTPPGTQQGWQVPSFEQARGANGKAGRPAPQRSAAERVMRDLVLQRAASPPATSAELTPSQRSAGSSQGASTSSGSSKPRWADVASDEEPEAWDFPRPCKASVALDGSPAHVQALEAALDAWERREADAQASSLELLRGSVLALSGSSAGCRAVQRAFDAARGSDRLELLLELRGHVWQASKSATGNYVLQRAVELLPPEHVQFVVEELQDRAVAVARHRFGVRVLQRLLEHCPSQQLHALVDAALVDAPRLVRHPFGNFFVQHLLEHGTDAQRERVASALLPELLDLSRHKIASNVVGRALALCSPTDRQRIVDELSKDNQELRSLSQSQYGSFVVRTAFGKKICK